MNLNHQKEISTTDPFFNKIQNPFWVTNTTRTESIVTGRVGDEHQSPQRPNSKISKQNEGILPIKKPLQMRGFG